MDTRVCVCQRDPTFDVIWMFCESFTKSFANFRRIRHFFYTRHVRQNRHFPGGSFRHLLWILNFHQPAAATFIVRHSIIFVRFVIFAEFIHFTRGGSWHLNFRHPSGKCSPYLPFPSNFPLWRGPFHHPNRNFAKSFTTLGTNYVCWNETAKRFAFFLSFFKGNFALSRLCF